KQTSWTRLSRVSGSSMIEPPILMTIVLPSKERMYLCASTRAAALLMASCTGDDSGLRAKGKSLAMGERGHNGGSGSGRPELCEGTREHRKGRNGLEVI